MERNLVGDIGRWRGHVVVCVWKGGGGGGVECADGRYTFPLDNFSSPKQLEIIGLSKSLFLGLAIESKVEVIEGGLTHKNM